MHRFLQSVPFDLYELALFHLVAKHGSFTKAAQVAGLTQSAVTRQVQGIENLLGVALFERTTRTVRLTEAGSYLFSESARMLGDVEQSLQRLAEEFAGARKEVRVAVSKTVGLAYLPGFFHRNRKLAPEVGYRVASLTSAQIIEGIEANEFDVGVISPPDRLQKTIRITHRFADAFALIAPAGLPPDAQTIDAMKTQSWLLIDERTRTGEKLRTWMRREGWRVEETMQLDNFDLIVNLVALGLGVSFVPVRALSLYQPRRKVARIATPSRFERELVVIIRQNRKQPPHVTRFIENILF